MLPGMMVPSFRTALAVQSGVEKKILIKTWGGLGDQVCAEPTLRFALKTFKGCEVSLASECPELFEHLDFKRTFNLKHERPIEENYLVFDTIVPTSHLTWEFMSHMIVNCVDFPSLCAFRCQLPVVDREVILRPSENVDLPYPLDPNREWIVVHAGRHWQSKTFPKDWWDAVIDRILSDGFMPILIGADTDDNRGTVDVNPMGCIDFRGKLQIMETVKLLQRNCSVLLTNDSSPLHMAVSGPAHIQYVATCKHPDYITHWRRGQWGWRMENMGRGGIWEVMDYCPNKENVVSAENVGDELLRSWLPDPEEFAEAAIAKHSSFVP